MNRLIQLSEEELKGIIREVIREELQIIQMSGGISRNGVIPLLTKVEAAKILGISLPTLDQLIKSNQLKVFRIGRHVKLKNIDIEEYLNKK